MPHCPNTNLLYNVKKRIILGKSLVCDGLGIFAGEGFRKNNFIGEYTGDIISHDMREIIYSNAGIHYTFSLRESMVITQLLISKSLFILFLDHRCLFVWK